MKTLFLAAGLLGLVACSSPDKKAQAEYVSECACGSPETAFDGCIDSRCASGEGHCANMDCLCGPLSIEE